MFDYYAAAIVWDNRSIVIPVNAINSVPLVGMALMEGYRLDIEVVDGGAVSLEPL